MDTLCAPRPPSAALGVPQRSPYRFLLAGAAVVGALAHIPVTPQHLSEAPYMGVLVIVLTAALLVLAAAALIRDTVEVHLTTVLACFLAILGYAATRTSPSPCCPTTSATGSNRSASSPSSAKPSRSVPRSPPCGGSRSAPPDPPNHGCPRPRPPVLVAGGRGRCRGLTRTGCVPRRRDPPVPVHGDDLRGRGS